VDGLFLTRVYRNELKAEILAKRDLVSVTGCVNLLCCAFENHWQQLALLIPPPAILTNRNDQFTLFGKINVD
jgi:hypothetical protein